jgi:hypothetical protein
LIWLTWVGTTDRLAAYLDEACNEADSALLVESSLCPSLTEVVAAILQMVCLAHVSLRVAATVCMPVAGAAFSVSIYASLVAFDLV